MKTRFILLASAFFNFLSAAFSQDAQEPNNSFGAAKTVAAGTTLSCSIHTNSDEDFFKMTVPTGGTITVEIPTSTSGVAVRLEVFSSASSNPLIANATAGVASGAVSVAAVVPAGDWFVVLSRNSGTASQTLFNVKFGFDSGDACEFNNDFGTACTVNLPASIQAKLWGVNLPTATNNDIDYYRATVPAGGVLTASIPTNSTGVQIRIEIFAENASTLLASEVAGAPSGSVNVAAVVPAGTYFIVVSRNSGTLSANSYTLNLNFDGSDECEFNNDFATACQLFPNSTFQAQLFGENLPTATNNDIDYFKTKLDQAGVLEASIAANTTGVQFRIEIYAENASTLLASAVAGSPSGSVSVPSVVPSGEYFIVVSRNSGTLSANPYTLSLKFDTSDDGEWNNDLATARAVAPNLNLKAHLWGVNLPTADNEDVDYYKMTVATATNVCVNIPLNSTQMRMRIELFNQSGSSLESVVSNANGSQTTLQKSVAAGTYFIKISRNSGTLGPQLFEVQFTCPGATAVEKIEAEAFFQLFPNPVEDVLQVDFSEARGRPTRLFLTDATGKVLLEKKLDGLGGSFGLNVEWLAAGLYFLKIETEKSSVARRFFKS